MTDALVSGSAGPPVVRSKVASGLPYPSYKSQLRADFQWMCAYCSISELEAAGLGFQIDHFHPKASGGTDEYANLFWACSHCNRWKSGNWPDAELEAAGCRFVRVDEDDPVAHMGEPDDQLMLNGTSTPGRYTIATLVLNRASLLRLRELRARLHHSQAVVAHGLRVIANTRLDDVRGPAKLDLLKLKQAAARDRDALEARVRDIMEEACRSTMIEAGKAAPYAERVRALRPPK